MVSSATEIPAVIGVAIASSGDWKIGCGSANDHGMMGADAEGRFERIFRCAIRSKHSVVVGTGQVIAL